MIILFVIVDYKHLCCVGQNMSGILGVVILLLGSPVVVANPLQESSQDNMKSLRLVMPAVSPQEVFVFSSCIYCLKIMNLLLNKLYMQ